MLNRRKAFSFLGGAAVAAPAVVIPVGPVVAAPTVNVALDVSGVGMTAIEIMNLGDKLAREIAAAQAKAHARAAGAVNEDSLEPTEVARRWFEGNPPEWRKSGFLKK